MRKPSKYGMTWDDAFEANATQEVLMIDLISQIASLWRASKKA